MNSTSIFLYGTSPSNDLRMRFFLGIFGSIMLISGTILIVYHNYAITNYFAVVFGIIAIIFSIGYRRLAKRSYLAIDDKNITSVQFDVNKPNLSPFVSPKKVILDWEEIKQINIGKTSFDITKNNDQKMEINLSNLTYKQMTDFKKILEEYSISKNKLSIT